MIIRNRLRQTSIAGSMGQSGFWVLFRVLFSNTNFVATQTGTNFEATQTLRRRKLCSDTNFLAT